MVSDLGTLRCHAGTAVCKRCRVFWNYWIQLDPGKVHVWMFGSFCFFFRFATASRGDKVFFGSLAIYFREADCLPLLSLSIKLACVWFLGLQLCSPIDIWKVQSWIPQHAEYPSMFTCIFMVTVRAVTEEHHLSSLEMYGRDTYESLH